MIVTRPYDPSWHAPGTVARSGRCSWHGVKACEKPPVVSFHDASGDRQSGCERAVAELLARGLMKRPPDYDLWRRHVIR